MVKLGLTEKFLYEVADVLDALSRSSGCGCDPTLTLTLAVVSTFIVSYSPSMFVHLIALALALPIATLGGRRAFAETLKVSATIAIISTVIVLPVLLGAIQVEEGLSRSLTLVTRTVAATTLFTAFVMNLGWLGVLRGLRGVGLPEEMAFSTAFTLRYVPLFIREGFRMLAAREARTLRGGNGYRILPSVVGDLLVKGYSRAGRVELAVRARLFQGARKTRGVKLNKHTVILIAATAILAAASVAGAPTI